MIICCVHILQAYSVHKVELKWESSVVEVLAKGYDVRYGARSIIYEVERQVRKSNSQQYTFKVFLTEPIILAFTGISIDRAFQQHFHYTILKY